MKQVSQEDRHRLDEYLTSVRTLEKKLEFSEKNQRPVPTGVRFRGMKFWSGLSARERTIVGLGMPVVVVLTVWFITIGQKLLRLPRES